MSSKLLKQFISEVLVGFGSPSAGKDGVAGNEFATSTGEAGVRPQAHASVLDDEAEEKQAAEQEERFRHNEAKEPKAKQAACCLIVSESGEVLAVARKDDPTMWGFPGGKVDPGETPEEAAARELREETGLVAKRLRLVYQSTDANGYEVFTYACEAEGEINTDETGLIRWVQPSVLLDPSSSPWVDYNRGVFGTLGTSG